MLLRGSEPVVLGGRAVALSRALIEKPGVLVPKDALIEAAWPGRAIEDSNLSVQIAALRRALEDAPGGERWIETMARRGYRFVGPVVGGDKDSVTAAPLQIDAPWDAAPMRHGQAPPRRAARNDGFATVRGTGVGARTRAERDGDRFLSSAWRAAVPLIRRRRPQRIATAKPAAIRRNRSLAAPMTAGRRCRAPIPEAAIPPAIAGFSEHSA
jgi:DNA-binding winged helix-turn-helix (wHTH) protein